MYVPGSETERDLVAASSFVTALDSKFYLWIGCSDADVEGSFDCADGSKLPTSSRKQYSTHDNQ